MFRWLTAGESHGRALVAICDGVPTGVKITTEDVAAAPSVTLRDAMALAAERDSVAREYATGFDITFGIGAPALRAARSSGLDWSDAVVETYLRLLATVPDTHVARKLGPAVAEAVSRRAREVEQACARRTAGAHSRPSTPSFAVRPTATIRGRRRI